MKSIGTLIVFSLLYLLGNAQTLEGQDLNQRVQEIEDRIALKELVDNFSILADKRDALAQTLLFSENGVVETYREGNQVANLIGRKQIGDAFAAFLKNFETVYHFNGQLIVSLHGDTASGVSYCSTTLIRNENGQRMITTLGVTYQDEFVRENNKWLIAKRKSSFDWEERLPLGQ